MINRGYSGKCSFATMTSLNKQQLMCLLTTLLTNETQIMQVLASYDTALLLLIDQYQKNQDILHDAVIERNRALRRYIRLPVR